MYMCNQYEIFTGPIGHLLHCQSLNKARKNKIKNEKLKNVVPINISFNNKHVNFDKQEQLKSKIMKAIVINNRGRQLQINYKKNGIEQLTQKQSTLQSRKLKIHLNRKPTKNNSFSSIQQQLSRKDGMDKKNFFFRITQILTDQQEKSQQKKYRCQSERCYRTNLTKRRSYTRTINRPKQISSSSFTTTQNNNDNIEIKPWISTCSRQLLQF